MLEVRLPGQFHVRRADTSIAIPSRAAQSLLAYLLLTAGTRHRREKLAGQLWPVTPEDSARKNLRTELWRLRNAIEGEKRRSRPAAYLVVDDVSIGWNAQSDYWLDMSIVLQPLGARVSPDHLIKTLSLYRGELLPGFYDNWVVLERERVRATFEQKMAHLLELLVEARRWPETLEWGERWIALGETPEPAYRALMVAYGAMGNMSQVASVYARCVHAMRDDLGVEPSEETRVLFESRSKSEKTPQVATSPLPRETHDESISASSRVTPPRRLPVPLTSFIGREREIEQVKQLLSTTRLLTLTGSGGVGKTRLATEVARELSSEYEHGVWWVDLVALADPAFVPQAVAQSLRVPEVPNVPLIETLAEALCSMQALLVLDNCEHLIAACAQLAESLLGACASLRILTTSREALGISAETVWRVPSLSLPEQISSVNNIDRYESIRLFLERARAAKPNFAIDDQNASPIIQICRRLDGIPLAIELAAARVRLLSPSEIEQRLRDRFSLLTTGSRTSLPRQKTLRGAMDWSYELLTEPERTLFRRLSVFSGGWTLEAAEQVCGSVGVVGTGASAGNALDLLSRLVDKSLVIAEEQAGAARYHFLETIKQFAPGKLIGSGEAERVKARHLDYFVRFAEQALSGIVALEEPAWMMRWLADVENLRAALEWSTNDEASATTGLRLAGFVARFLEPQGHFVEELGWIERLLQRAGEGSARLAR